MLVQFDQFVGLPNWTHPILAGLGMFSSNYFQIGQHVVPITCIQIVSLTQFTDN